MKIGQRGFTLPAAVVERFPPSGGGPPPPANLPGRWWSRTVQVPQAFFFATEAKNGIVAACAALLIEHLRLGRCSGRM